MLFYSCVEGMESLLYQVLQPIFKERAMKENLEPILMSALNMLRSNFSKGSMYLIV
jgi:hypothetical protein